jgi:hypothetical protein
MRCADASFNAGERLFATATTASRWLLVEVPGGWPRDVSAPDTLPADIGGPVAEWLETPGSRMLFVRRPGKTRAGRQIFVVDAAESRVSVRKIVLDDLSDLARVDLERDGESS